MECKYFRGEINVTIFQESPISKARSMTSSSSPLESPDEGGGSESDEAYGSGHISSVKTIQSISSSSVCLQ